MRKWNRILVGFLRGVGLAAAAAAITFVTDLLVGGDIPPAFEAFVPVGLMALRTLEGIVDQARKGPESVERNVVGL